MLTKVDVRTSQGSILSLPLQDISSGVIVEGIEGLDPVKATLVSSSFAQLDGAQYHSSRREARNIKLRLGFDPDYTTTDVRELRNSLYNFLMPKSLVDLIFYQELGLDILDLTIAGRIESFTAPLFTEDPGVDVSIVCFDPDFYNPDPIELTKMSTPGLSEDVVTYEGTVETGFVFRIRPDHDLSAFTIYQRPPDGTFRTLDFSSPLIAGDVLTISTMVGSKTVTRTRGGLDVPLLYALSPQSNWLELQPGDNFIRVYAEGTSVPFDIEYTNKYGGL